MKEDDGATTSATCTTTSPPPPSANPPPIRPPTRRSARVLDHDPIVAPGFGTQKDILRLSQQLSSPNTVFPPEAALEMMSARGRGLRSSRGEKGQDDEAANNASSGGAADAAAASLWTDFMKEEGVTTTSTATTPATSGRNNKGSSTSTSTSSNKREGKPTTSTQPGGKRQKKAAVAGVLVQTGTLDFNVVGRGQVKKDEENPFHLFVPTVLPILAAPSSSIKISRVFTSCNAVHSIAIDTNGRPYGWGRNESNQLGSRFPSSGIVLPTPLFDHDGDSSFPSSPIAAAAMGKSHTLLLTTDGSVWAVGANKVGQCGIHKAGESVANFRQCTLPDNVVMTQIACGEDFSGALDSQGTLYTTGSSEYGQLGNGETGEYFVSANKLAFANCATFMARKMFVHAPAEKLHTSNETCKTVPLEDSSKIVLESIACGKHHGIAIEKTTNDKPRVFSWGCGNYGCLGHGVQADEYFPRKIGLFTTLPNLTTTTGGGGGEGDVKISSGAQCSLLQTASGHVYYWGKHRSVGEAVMRPALVDVLANNGHVVNHCKAGGQTVVCCTSLDQCVAWGQGPYGELGLADKKSSAKPTFVEALDGRAVLDLACGYGHTLFVVEDAKDMPQVNPEDVEHLEKAISSKKGK